MPVAAVVGVAAELVTVGVVTLVEEPTPPDPVGDAVEPATGVPAVPVVVAVCAAAGAERRGSSAGAMHAIASPILQRIKALTATRSVPRAGMGPLMDRQDEANAYPIL